MYPELFTICGFTVYTYGICIATGFFVAMQYVVLNSKIANISKNQIYDLFFYLIVFGILGARLFYVLTEMNYFIKHPVEIIQIWKGGLVYYGGFISSLIFGIWYLYKKHINIKKVLDTFAPAIALGHVFGRLGCFFSGCCYGKECDFFLSIDNRYPTQLFEAFGNLIIFILLHRFNKSKHKNGQIFVLYLFFYSLLRFFVEFLRGDDRGIFILGLSVAQVI
ncbi:prolipoprotein diacylglyceryl transferase, partial [Candidatus Ruminimicrobium bovinum]|uniref:prolipoprotein diacylglyceryl transferase n=1 Tax=Candidatus Ruminimicrobium bovinum TaxID=3242779 RepID=UPI0039B92019